MYTRNVELEMNERTVQGSLYEHVDTVKHYITTEKKQRKIELLTTDEEDPFCVQVEYKDETDEYWNFERAWQFEDMQDAVQMIVHLQMDDVLNLDGDMVDTPFEGH